jgi:hypothetical protein
MNRIAHVMGISQRAIDRRCQDGNHDEIDYSRIRLAKIKRKE